MAYPSALNVMLQDFVYDQGVGDVPGIVNGSVYGLPSGVSVTSISGLTASGDSTYHLCHTVPSFKACSYT